MAGRHDEAVAFSWRWIQGRVSSPAARHASAVFSATVAAFAPSDDRAESWKTSGESVSIPPRSSPPPDARTAHKHTWTSDLDSDIGGAAALNRGAGSCSSASDAAREGDPGDDGPRPLTVACVRWGDKYGPEYVVRLAAGVRRHLRRDHRFVCYTDDVEALREAAGVVAKPLGTACGGWRGWWHKAFLFSGYVYIYIGGTLLCRWE